MKAAAQPADGINALFDHVSKSYNLRTDANLARFLDLAPSVICKLRRGTYGMSDRVILRIYENTDLTLQQIRNYFLQPLASDPDSIPADGAASGKLS